MTTAIAERRPFDLLKKLEAAGALTPISLDLSDEKLTYDRWQAIGAMLGAAHRSLAFLIGDWLIFGEGLYGEKYAQGASSTGLSEETLMTYAWVCRSVPKGRRREELPFSAHRAVASLDPAAQRRWLDRAVREGWRGGDLGRAIREARESSNGSEPQREVETNLDSNRGLRAERTRALLERAVELASGSISAAERDDLYRGSAEVLDELEALEKAAGARSLAATSNGEAACPECGRPLGEE